MNSLDGAGTGVAGKFAGAALTLLLLTGCGSSNVSAPNANGNSTGDVGTGTAGSSSLPPPPATTNQNIETPYCERASAPVIGDLVEVERRALTARTLELSLQSSAMQKVEKILVTLPQDYDASGRTQYPVLYLLHGAFDDHTSYFTHGLEEVVGDMPLVVIQPDPGALSFYSDWYGSVLGSGQTPLAAETYILDELIPYVEARFPVSRERSGRAVAGLSMGGLGTMKFAAARPELFAAAGSFSGALNVTRNPALFTGLSAVSVALGPLNYCTWGDPQVQTLIWHDNDPTHLAESLRGVPIWLSCGGGPAREPTGVNTAGDPLEIEVCEETESFAKALDALGIPHTDSLYDNGTHTWDHWMRELGLYLAWMDQRLAAPLPPPTSFDYRSAREHFSAWGWQFHAYRDAREFIYLNDVARTGLKVTGSGVLDVITPALYQPGRSYRLTVNDASRSLLADQDGRLKFRLDLGPSHVPQQMDVSPEARTGWTQLEVSITDH